MALFTLPLSGISQAIRGCYLKLLTNYFRNRKYNNILPVFPTPPALQMHSTIFSSVKLIHNALTERAPENDFSDSPHTDRPLCDVQFQNFQQVTLDMVKKFAVKTLTKSCQLDPLPASVLKTCFPIILPTCTNIDYKHVPQEWCDATCFES